MLAHEPWIRFAFFAGALAVLASAEALWPRRRRSVGRMQRWPSNLCIVALNTLAARVLLPTTAVGIAMSAELRGWGLLNAYPVASWLAVAVSFIVLDLGIYAQHVAFHRVPVLWRLHRMHHADVDFDVTTATRFHTLEILLSFAIKFAIIVALGAPAVAVLLFEIVLSSAAMFNHANLKLGPRADRWLRLVLVTPDMHRVHHSVHADEHNTNFGFNLPWWDRLFGTYRSAPRDGHERMTIGLERFRSAGEQRLDRLLRQPWR
jgi:sterol desaturase/sphingolipid hydroxylase (fatty acid hydroxylase superfamily)